MPPYRFCCQTTDSDRTLFAFGDIEGKFKTVERISAEAGALVAGAQAAVEAKQEIVQRVNAVQSAASGTRGAWSGPAAQRYYELIDNWELEAKKIANILDQLEESLRRTAGDQASADESFQGTIGNLGSMMGGAS